MFICNILIKSFNEKTSDLFLIKCFLKIALYIYLFYQYLNQKMNMIRQRQQKFSIEIRREQREEFIRKQRGLSSFFLELGFGEYSLSIERAFIDVESKCYEELLLLVKQNQDDEIYFDVIDFVLHSRIVLNWEAIPKDYKSEGVVDQVINLFEYKCPRLNAICLQYLVCISFLGHDEHIFRTLSSVGTLLVENTNFFIWDLIMKFLGNMAADCRECRDMVDSYAVLNQVQTTVEKPELSFEEIESLHTLIDNFVKTEPYPKNTTSLILRLIERNLFKIKDLQQITDFTTVYCYVIQKSQQRVNYKSIEYLLDTLFKIGSFNDQKQVLNLAKLIMNIISESIYASQEFIEQAINFAFVLLTNQNIKINQQIRYGLQILINLMQTNGHQYAYLIINDPRMISINFETLEYFGLIALISQQGTPEELLQYNLIKNVLPYLSREYEELDYDCIDNILVTIYEVLRKIPHLKGRCADRIIVRG
ncbi:hypothetical protein pb186bvf_009957 [Paramecium bursaria]